MLRCLPLVLEVLVVGPVVLSECLAVRKDAVTALVRTFEEHV